MGLTLTGTRFGRRKRDCGMRHTRSADRGLTFDTGEGDAWTVHDLVLWVGHEGSTTSKTSWPA